MSKVGKHYKNPKSLNMDDGFGKPSPGKMRPAVVTDKSRMSALEVQNPPIRLLAKIASILVHLDEGFSAGGHHYDFAAINALMGDREVSAWVEGMQAASLAPMKRS